MMWMLRNKNLVLSVRNYGFKDLDFRMIRRILHIGVPNGLENSMFQIGKILVTSVVAIHGTTAIAANAVSGSLASIEIIPAASMGLALMTVVSRCVGANQYDQANEYIKRMMKYSHLFMFIISVFVLIFLHPILNIYSLTDQTHQTAYEMMRLHSITAIVFWPLSFTLPNAFRAAGDVKFPMIVSTLSMWIFRIGFSYLFTYIFRMGVIRHLVGYDY